MIISRISGGLGNQMFQYAIAKSMAKKNNDISKLDVFFYPKQTLRKHELNKFNIEEDIASKKECNNLRASEGFIFKVKNKLGLNISRPKFYTYEYNITSFDKEVFDKNGDIYLDGFWQNENYFKSIREEIINDFTPKDRISDEVNRYLQDIKSVNSVSLHIRRGDYLADKHTNSVHGVSGLDYYKNATEYISTKIENPIFYIFSDDITWCKENFTFLQNKIFIDDTKSAIDDLELMKKCKHNIIANSTFSWWGAWLNQNDKKIVIAPKVWFIDEKWQNLSITLNDWIKI
ncbi:MAG: alpha-1,2-fucosyltransferase [Flavobacteriales bacterium]|nr:alpha-1,2-fucosyltransferase [Flavobacteriales bacterium]